MLLCLFHQPADGLVCRIAYISLQVGAVLIFLHGLLLGLAYDGSYILHGLKEGDAETLARQFLAAVHCPVSVLEVVMFDAAELLDISISAVVVGHKEAFRRYDFSGTSSSELHDGIFQRRVVDVIDIFRREFTAELLHCLGIHLLQKRKHPHAFVGPCGAEGYRECGKYAYYPFHVFVFQKSVGSSCFRWKLLRWCGV